MSGGTLSFSPRPNFLRRVLHVTGFRISFHSWVFLLQSTFLRQLSYTQFPPCSLSHCCCCPTPAMSHYSCFCCSSFCTYPPNLSPPPGFSHLYSCFRFRVLFCLIAVLSLRLLSRQITSPTTNPTRTPHAAVTVRYLCLCIDIFCVLNHI
jgi:hypothetical protein